MQGKQTVLLGVLLLNSAGLSCFGKTSTQEGQVRAEASARTEELPGGGMALPDRGIFPALQQQVRVVPPHWWVTGGPLAIRLDVAKGTGTLFRGQTPVWAFAWNAADKNVPTSVEMLLARMHEDDVARLRPFVPAGTAVSIVSTPLTVAEDLDQDGVINAMDVSLGAKKLGINRATYASQYRSLAYPGGDVPQTEGVCTDTVIRALRNAGLDLQKEVHEDIVKNPGAYGFTKGKSPDANIDHRRVKNMLPWFLRHADRFEHLPQGGPLAPGDVVFMDTFPSKAGPEHVGIVSDRLGNGVQPLILNNWTDGYREQEMDIISVAPVTHAFRMK